MTQTSPTALRSLVEAVARDLATRRDELNRLDGVAGDGDLGLTAAAAAAALIEVAPSLDALPEGEAIRRCGRELASRAPSTGGTLIALALMAAGRAEVDPGAPSLARAAAYLRVAADTIAARGNVSSGDRTMLDALLPAVEVLERDATLREAAAAADAGAAATATMEPTVGRAGWLADRARGHEDAGARLIAVLFEAAAAAALSLPSPS